MKTLRNIHEGFFSNVGATGALYKSKLIEYFENINKIANKFPHINQYTIKTSIDALKSAPDDWFADGLSSLLTKRNPSDEAKIRAVKNFFSTSLIITSDVFDPNITTLPNWFKINSILGLYGGSFSYYSEYLFVYIDGMTNLDPKEVVDFLKKLKTVNGIHIVNCPKFKSLDGFPPVIGKYGLTFIPSPNVKFRYSDVLKHFENISGPIIFNRVDINNEEKLLKKAAAKAANDTKIKTDKKVNAISNGKDITKEPKERTKIKPWNGSLEDAPIWKVDERNRVYMPDGTEFGRLTRDCTTVYRQVNKALFVKHAVYSIHPGDIIGYAYDKKDNLVCKLIRGNV